MTDSTPGDGQAVNAHDLLVLARIAGLPIDDDRAAGLARELSITLSAVRDVDALLADQPVLDPDAFAPFDPAWPGEAASTMGTHR